MKARNEKTFFMGNPRVISIGGGIPGREQDTIHNLTLALGAGSDVLRTNAFVLAGGDVVCVSDQFVRKTKLDVSGITSMGRDRLMELHELHYGDDAPEKREDLFPGLSEALDAFPSARFNIHVYVKAAAHVDAVCAAIVRAGAAERTLFSAMHGAAIARARKALPVAASAMSLYGLIWFYGLFRSGLLTFSGGFTADALLLQERIGNSFFGSSTFMTRAAEKGLRTFVYLDDDESQLVRLLDAGAPGFITGNVPLVKKAILERETNEGV